MIDWQPIETAPRDGTNVLLAILLTEEKVVTKAILGEWLEFSGDNPSFPPPGWYCVAPRLYRAAELDGNGVLAHGYWPENGDGPTHWAKIDG